MRLIFWPNRDHVSQFDPNRKGGYKAGDLVRHNYEEFICVKTPTPEASSGPILGKRHYGSRSFAAMGRLSTLLAAACALLTGCASHPHATVNGIVHRDGGYFWPDGSPVTTAAGAPWRDPR